MQWAGKFESTVSFSQVKVMIDRERVRNGRGKLFYMELTMEEKRGRRESRCVYVCFESL